MRIVRANHFKVEEEVVLSGGAVSKSREVGPESRIEDFLSENLGRVLIAKVKAGAPNFNTSDTIRRTLAPL